jgi:competence protein ComGC
MEFYTRTMKTKTKSETERAFTLGWKEITAVLAIAAFLLLVFTGNVAAIAWLWPIF